LSRTDLERFRAAYCACLTAAFLIAAPSFYAVYRAEIFWPWFPLPGLPYLAVVYIFLLVSLVMASLGFVLRLSLPMALLFACAVVAPIATEGHYPMSDILFYVLMALIIAAYFPTVEFKGLFPKTIAIVLGSIYFNSFLNKMHHGATGWLDGSTLQSYILIRAYTLDHPWILKIAENKDLCCWLSRATLVFEAGFLPAIFSRRILPLFLIAGVLFHFCVYILLDVNFMLFYVPAYLVFLNWSRIPSFKTAAN
jgi:hypothetical protein